MLNPNVTDFSVIVVTTPVSHVWAVYVSTAVGQCGHMNAIVWKMVGITCRQMGHSVSGLYRFHRGGTNWNRQMVKLPFAMCETECTSHFWNVFAYNDMTSQCRYTKIC